MLVWQLFIWKNELRGKIHAYRFSSGKQPRIVVSHVWIGLPPLRSLAAPLVLVEWTLMRNDINFLFKIFENVRNISRLSCQHRTAQYSQLPAALPGDWHHRCPPPPNSHPALSCSAAQSPFPSLIGATCSVLRGTRWTVGAAYVGPRPGLRSNCQESICREGSTSQLECF